MGRADTSVDFPKGHDELAEFVCTLAERYPELREELRERIALSEGDVDRLVAQARRELRDRTSEVEWQNHWNHEGYTPDYSRLKHRLERLVELGNADAVVNVGRKFIARAMRQVEESHDEGETAMAAVECLPVIFEAVLKSSLSSPQKLLFAIDADLKDEYNVLDDSATVILDGKWTKSDWSAVADELSKRLRKLPVAGNEFSLRYRRDRVSDWLLAHWQRPAEAARCWQSMRPRRGPPAATSAWCGT